MEDPNAIQGTIAVPSIEVHDKILSSLFYKWPQNVAPSTKDLEPGGGDSNTGYAAPGR